MLPSLSAAGPPPEFQIDPKPPFGRQVYDSGLGQRVFVKSDNPTRSGLGITVR